MPNSTTIECFSVGDLVAFNFPYADGGSKTRICAVVAQDPEFDEVVIAYGSSNLQLKNNPDRALTVFAREDVKRANLHEATRFQVDRRIRVKLNDPRFKQRMSLGTAKVGQLPAAQTHRLGALYHRLPTVSHHQEMQGIHPKLVSKPRRPTFLERRKAGQGAAIAAA